MAVNMYDHWRLMKDSSESQFGIDISIACPVSSTIWIFNVTRRSLAILPLQEKVNCRQGGSKFKMDAVVAGRSGSRRWFRGFKWYIKTPEYRLQQAFRWFWILFYARGLLCRLSKNLELRLFSDEMSMKRSYKQLCRADFSAGLHLLHCKQTCASVARHIIHCQSSFAHIFIICS